MGNVLYRQAFDAWGQRRNAQTWVTDDSQVPAAQYRWLWGYTGHEMLDEFGLINMNARLYDPKLGRMLSVDNYVSDATSAIAYNRYSYANCNPISYIDPDGNFIIPLLYFTDFGYQAQKYFSPVAVKFNLPFGSHNTGIGMDVSVGIPKLSFLSYRYEAGATYFSSNRMGNYGSGWQVRTGGEWSYLGFCHYGGTRYRDYDASGKLVADQVVHTLTVGSFISSLSYSNDTKNSFPWHKYVPLIPKLNEGPVYGERDGLRTASGKWSAGLFEFGFFLHTGEGSYLGYDQNGNWSQLGGTSGQKGRSNGIIYFGFAGFKVGRDSESIRHFVQNRVAHDGNWAPWKWIGILNGSTPNHNNGSNYWPWVPAEERENRLVFQFGNF